MRKLFDGVRGSVITVKGPKMTPECIICDPWSQKSPDDRTPDPLQKVVSFRILPHELAVTCFSDFLDETQFDP